MKPLTLVAILFILSSCQQVTKSRAKTRKETAPASHDLIIPDSSISNFLKLRDPVSTPDSIKKAIKDNVVILSNKDETRFLIAYQYPGDPLGSFIGFELSGLSTEIVDYPIKTNIPSFVTENGVSNNCELEEILKFKGNNYYKTEENGLATYSFNDVPEDFLDRHNSEEYFFEVQAMEGLLNRIQFGFIVKDSTENTGRLEKVKKDL
jgi:hypothetical protein